MYATHKDPRRDIASSIIIVSSRFKFEFLCMWFLCSFAISLSLSLSAFFSSLLCIVAAFHSKTTNECSLAHHLTRYSAFHKIALVSFALSGYSSVSVAVVVVIVAFVSYRRFLDAWMFECFENILVRYSRRDEMLWFCCHSDFCICFLMYACESGRMFGAST